LKKDGKMAFYGINFDFNSATIQESSTESLEVISAYLKNKKDVQVFIVGHTDNVGTYAQNLTLSQKRAEAIVDYLSKNFSKYFRGSSEITIRCRWYSHASPQ
jgi:OmpA-OmpF porin, OOP family